jgi:hypothetical protein
MQIDSCCQKVLKWIDAKKKGKETKIAGNMSRKRSKQVDKLTPLVNCQIIDATKPNQPGLEQGSSRQEIVGGVRLA